MTAHHPVVLSDPNVDIDLRLFCCEVTLRVPLLVANEDEGLQLKLDLNDTVE